MIARAILGILLAVIGLGLLAFAVFFPLSQYAMPLAIAGLVTSIMGVLIITFIIARELLRDMK